MIKTETMNEDRTIYSPDEAGDKQLVFDLITSMYGGIALMARAQQRKLNPDVIDLAKKLETAHTKLTEELKMYASDKGWLIPAGEVDADVANREEVMKLDNASFQQRWLDLLRERHQLNITRLENANPSDSKLKNMGEKGLSKLKDLLGDIMDVENSVH